MDQNPVIGEDYTDQALDLIRKVIKGNGVKLDDVNIKSFEGSILEFDALTTVKLSTQISGKTVPGKAQGSAVFQNRQQAHEAVQNYAGEVLQDPALTKQVEELILQQDHKGFGLHNENIKVSFLDKEFICHEPCQPCHGKGQVKCAKCHGKGYEPCPHCRAEGFIMCQKCNGNTQIPGPQGQMQSCDFCQGLGKTSCSFCKEARQIQCSICKTKGESTCKTCGGQGTQSEVIRAEITAQCMFDFDPGPLPERAAFLVGELGKGLTEYAQVVLVDKQDSEEGEQDEFHVHYKVQLPQGNVQFSIKDREIPAYLFGINGELRDAPDFLDELIAPGIKELEKAAVRPGDISKNIQKAVRYKTIRQAVTLAARYNSSKAMKAVLHYTPLGLSQNAAQNLIEHANAALNNATKQQRKVSIAAGAGSIGILGGVYFLSPVRSVLLAQINNASFHIAADVIVLGVCVALGYFVWQAMLANARKTALKNFLPAK